MAFTRPITRTVISSVNFGQECYDRITRQLAGRFTNAAARNTGIPTPAEGVLAWLDDINALQAYDGARWATLGLGTVGYAERTATQSNIPTGTITDLADLAATFTATAGRSYMVTAQTQPQPSGNTITGEIRNAASSSVGRFVYQASTPQTAHGGVVLSNLSGVTTLKLSYSVSAAGNAVSNGASGSAKSFILVQDIGILP